MNTEIVLLKGTITNISRGLYTIQVEEDFEELLKNLIGTEIPNVQKAYRLKQYKITCSTNDTVWFQYNFVHERGLKIIRREQNRY